jgi:alkylation response protein AidB-like acyl-CoA dehydrogenase
MDFSYTPEQEAFRMELRRWIEENLDPDLRVYDAMDERVAASREVLD